MTTTHTVHGESGSGSIADPFRDLLAALDEGARQGFVRRLAVGYYEGWRPTRAEVATLVALETGRITETEYLATLTPPGAPPDHPIGTASNPTDAAAAATARPAFGVDCGELLPPFRFIARGLSHDGWVRHDGDRYRLVSLHYELQPPRTTTTSTTTPPPAFFTAPILCVPDVPALRTISDGQSVNHLFGSESFAGSRGPWALSPVTRQLRFLIYKQSTGRRPHRHPAGALRVNLLSGEWDWKPVGPTRRAPRRAPSAAAGRRVEEPGASPPQPTER